MHIKIKKKIVIYIDDFLSFLNNRITRHINKSYILIQ